MNLITLEDTTNIYTCGKEVRLRWYSVQFLELQNFAFALDRFISSLGDSSKDEIWSSLIRSLKKTRFDFCAAPLSDEVLHISVASLLVAMNEKLELCQLLYPNTLILFSLLINQMDELSKIKLSRLIEALIELVGSDEEGIGLLIHEPRLIPLVEDSILIYPKLNNITVLNSYLLKEEKCYKKLIVFGPSRWYPDYIFSAPRAPDITIVKLSWIKDYWKNEKVFVEPINQRANKTEGYIFQDLGEEATLTAEDLLLPAFDFQKIADRVITELNESEDSDDTIDARIFILEDDWAVFLDSDETSTVMVIDLDCESTEPIKRKRIGEVRPGMFVLLRTGGGGDYIIPIADRIMGEEASIAREFQKEWKRHLRLKTRTFGYDHVITLLKDLGSIRANHINVHNWMSERSIKPEYKADFKAILGLINFEKDTEVYWEMMKAIDRAHIKAGQLIRKMLLEQVRGSNLNSLKKIGIMEFTIPGEESVSITAFQVKDISPNVFAVSTNQIGDPFKPYE